MRGVPPNFGSVGFYPTGLIGLSRQSRFSMSAFGPTGIRLVLSRCFIRFIGLVGFESISTVQYLQILI